MKIKSIKQAKKLAGKVVLLRVDFNVPINNGKVTEEYKLLMSLPTIRLLIQNQANLLLEINCNTLSGVKKGSSALDIAYNKNKHNTIIELINAPDPDEINELHYYAAKENKEMIQKVITKENDVKKIKQMIEDRDRYGGKPVDINESLEEYFSQLSFNQSP